MQLNNDGSVVGQTFSGDKFEGEYPVSKDGETYRQYRNRVGKLRDKGFHLGDLSWDDWDSYCKGSGSFEGVDADDSIQ